MKNRILHFLRWLRDNKLSHLFDIFALFSLLFSINTLINNLLIGFVIFIVTFIYLLIKLGWFDDELGFELKEKGDNDEETRHS